MNSVPLLLLAVSLPLLLGGCGEKEDGNTGVVNPNEPSPKAIPEKLIADPIVEKAIRESLNKLTGELTEADLARIDGLYLGVTQITDAGLKELAKLQKLEVLNLHDTKITDAGLKEVAKLQKLERLYLGSTKITDKGAAELRKALPKCDINHSYKKD